MLTTEGSTCLAIWLNEFDSSTGLGITSGVAPGATWPAILGRLDAPVDQGADHDADRQREQHQRERKNLLRAQFVKDTHGPSYSSCVSQPA
jgi:hypothetical protein